ncbi:hypothetical protein EVG20_g6976 [Dentipellis fragilis]|uniref:E2 ubiquitin-conjugating enzyme n=1 Tax=Dentipellis fragilis TaxID=205917 RepID=A0A4Y9YI22_9AGAM|nr:hypothetical protein EVG20_g6976 [Dentipellis fragilis]
MSVPPSVMRRIMRELAELRSSPPEGVRVAVNEDNMLDVTGIIEGPEGTPYAGGYFRVKFKFTDEFPAAPPKCWFTTKIFHPNVSPTGDICVSTLKKDWNPSYGIGHILVTVKCLLIYPNPDSALDEEAGRLVQEDWNSYCERARMYTSVHATPKVPPPEFATPAALPAATTDAAAPTASSSTASADLKTSATLASLPSAPSLTSSPPLPAHKMAISATAAATAAQPLQCSPSNLSMTTSSSLSSLSGSEKDKGKERLTSPAPLGTADSNVASMGGGGANKAVKRAATAGSGPAAEGQKRKKALKRL